MQDSERLHELIAAFKQRLHLLQIREATQGISVDPAVPIEIAELEHKIRDLEDRVAALADNGDPMSVSPINAPSIITPPPYRHQENPAPGAASNPRLEEVRRALLANDVQRALDLSASIPGSLLAETEELRLIADVIEQPRLSLDLRLRAAQIAAGVGDPRQGVCTLEPGWCEPIASGVYSIAGGRTTVQLSTFRIARYPVTVWQYGRFWTAGGYRDRRWWTPQGWAWREDNPITDVSPVISPFRWGDLELGGANLPVVGVSWYEASAFCRWLTNEGFTHGWLGRHERVRLPNEAEWEVAASLGSRSPSRSHMPTATGPFSAVVPVGALAQVSPCGALDMAGNVWEWCTSHYGDYPLAAHTVRDDFAPGDEGPALRGGSWTTAPDQNGAHARMTYLPTYQVTDFGFRLCAVGTDS